MIFFVKTPQVSLHDHVCIWTSVIAGKRFPHWSQLTIGSGCFLPRTWPIYYLLNLVTYYKIFLFCHWHIRRFFIQIFLKWSWDMVLYWSFRFLSDSCKLGLGGNYKTWNTTLSWIKNRSKIKWIISHFVFLQVCQYISTYFFTLLQDISFFLLH